MIIQIAVTTNIQASASSSADGLSRIAHTSRSDCVCDVCDTKRIQSGPIRYPRPSEYVDGLVATELFTLCSQCSDLTVETLEADANRRREKYLARRRQIKINAEMQARQTQEAESNQHDYELMSSEGEEQVSSSDELDESESRPILLENNAESSQSPHNRHPKTQKMHRSRKAKAQ